MRSWPAPAAAPGRSPACHQPRHTCLTRLREAGMALEAVQARAGHAPVGAGPGLPAPGQRLAGLASTCVRPG